LKHAHSVIGAVLVIVGLYLVLWGKSKEMIKGPHPEIKEIEVVVTSTTLDHDNITTTTETHQ